MATAQQPFPKLDAEFVDEGRRITQPWYRLLIQLWQLTGGAVPLASGVYLVQSGGQIIAYAASTGKVIGPLAQVNAPGGPAVPQVLGASPFLFTAPGGGTLVVFGAEVEVSRDGGATYHAATLTGGTVPLLSGDVARVSWLAGTPQVTWLPAS